MYSVDAIYVGWGGSSYVMRVKSFKTEFMANLYAWWVKFSAEPSWLGSFRIVVDEEK